jgi:PhzF family phenazine biosynthesis protein
MTRYLSVYQIDAFTDKLFHGNPAAVVILEDWLDNAVMQKIAMENNLSETAFIVPRGSHFEITWFTPVSEIDLCGHATLSSAHVIFNILNHKGDEILFKTRQAGDLSVRKDGDIFYLNFPSRPPQKIDTIAEQAIIGLGGAKPDEIHVSRDFMLVYPNSDMIRTMKPDFKLLEKAGKWIIVTAPGSKEDGCDFVSRMFCAGDGIEEDPVTGSSHCTLIPYWAEKLNKKTMIAKQLSGRGGTLYCDLMGERVQIGGKSVTYLAGKISL